jgi:hypothetical protein
MMTPEKFLEIMRGYAGDEVTNYRLGKIDPDYTDGAARIVFDGETEPSGKRYNFIDSYRPVPGERVLLCRVADTYLILGCPGSGSTGMPVSRADWRRLLGVLYRG